MTNILELLKHEKVEWKKLKNILISINTGLNPRKKFVLNDKSEVLTSWYITTKDYSQNEKIEFLENKTARISEEARKKINQRSRLEKGDLLFSAVGTVGKIALVDIEPSNFDVNESTFILKPDYSIVNNRYLMYYLRGSVFQDKLHSKLRGSTLSGIRKGDLECMEIPIPSLETQEKIVEILDKFTNYVKELQSELQSRNKQYEYYRDMLLSEDYLNKVTKKMEEDRILKIVQLDEVIKIKNGKDWKELEEGDIPVYGSGGEMGVYVSKYAYDKPTVLIPRKGSIKNVFYIETPFWNVDTIFYTEIDESKLIPKYFYYFIEYFDLSKLSENSTRPSLTQSTLNGLKFPLPSLSLQNKIVKILDKFQVMLADTKGLLPEEIAQRQKQYEYYREKLLTFETDCDSTHARTLILSNHYYELLQEVSKIVGVITENKVEIKTLGEICIINRGASPRPISKYITTNYENSIPWIKIGDTSLGSKCILGTKERITLEGAKKSRVLKKGDFILSNSMSYGRPYILNISGAIHDGWASISDFKEYLISDYLYYYLSLGATQNYWKLKMNTSSVSNLNSEIIKSLPIIIPPLHVQQHIVSILDKFDTLVHDIKEGLPKEIELRQKQYEYWREQLLSFNR